uniref:Uncharacterized protein n=1 Tax=viral metagenome TaxID=1070528 RepID=A0A2V0RB15_9ZZZZ
MAQTYTQGSTVYVVHGGQLVGTTVLYRKNEPVSPGNNTYHVSGSTSKGGIARNITGEIHESFLLSDFEYSRMSQDEREDYVRRVTLAMASPPPRPPPSQGGGGLRSELDFTADEFKDSQDISLMPVSNNLDPQSNTVDDAVPPANGPFPLLLIPALGGGARQSVISVGDRTLVANRQPAINMRPGIQQQLPPPPPPKIGISTGGGGPSNPDSSSPSLSGPAGNSSLLNAFNLIRSRTSPGDADPFSRVRANATCVSMRRFFYNYSITVPIIRDGLLRRLSDAELQLDDSRPSAEADANLRDLQSQIVAHDAKVARRRELDQILSHVTVMPNNASTSNLLSEQEYVQLVATFDQVASRTVGTSVPLLFDYGVSNVSTTVKHIEDLLYNYTGYLTNANELRRRGSPYHERTPYPTHLLDAHTDGPSPAFNDVLFAENCFRYGVNPIVVADMFPRSLCTLAVQLIDSRLTRGTPITLGELTRAINISPLRPAVPPLHTASTVQGVREAISNLPPMPQAVITDLGTLLGGRVNDTGIGPSKPAIAPSSSTAAGITVPLPITSP